MSQLYRNVNNVGWGGEGTEINLSPVEDVIGIVIEESREISPMSYFRRLSLSLYMDADTSRYLRTNDVRRHSRTPTEHLSKVMTSCMNTWRHDVWLCIMINAVLLQDMEIKRTGRIVPVIAKLRHGTKSRRLPPEEERGRRGGGGEREKRTNIFPCSRLCRPSIRLRTWYSQRAAEGIEESIQIQGCHNFAVTFDSLELKRGCGSLVSLWAGSLVLITDDQRVARNVPLACNSMTGDIARLILCTRGRRRLSARRVDELHART